MDETQQQKPGSMLDLHFATEDSDSSTVLRFSHSSEHLRFLHVYEKKNTTQQSRTETDCSVSEESVKGLSGVWMLGGPRERH